jgi:hypothetical protein
MHDKEADANAQGQNFRADLGGIGRPPKFSGGVSEWSDPTQAGDAGGLTPREQASIGANLGLGQLTDMRRARALAEQRANIGDMQQSYDEHVLNSVMQPKEEASITTESVGPDGRAFTMRQVRDPNDTRSARQRALERMPGAARMAMEAAIAPLEQKDRAQALAEKTQEEAQREAERHHRGLEEAAITAARAKGVKPVTGAERKALGFYNRALEASDTIAPIEDSIGQMSLAGQTRLQYAPNFLQSPEGQSYRQAQRTFTEARLRKESGAAVPTSEYENDAKTYFAQPGDTPKALEQKRKARQAVLDGIAFESGKAYDEFYGESRPGRGGGGDVIYARDPQGNIHSAKKGTALPAGWQVTNAPGGGE